MDPYLPDLYLSELLVLGAGVLIGSFAGTGAMLRLSHRYGWIAVPREDRWHRRSTALHGGAGFVPIFLVAAAWIAWRAIPSSPGGWGLLSSGSDLALALAFLAGSVVMFGIGLLDDFLQFRPATKLLWQVVAASVFIAAGGVFHVTGFPMLDIGLTYFWFIGITNAVNMLDNMDGLCSGIAIISTLTAILIAIQNGGASLGVVFGILLVAAVAGFWWYNKAPASIFMGDSGSLFLGFSVAALAMPTALNGAIGIEYRQRGIEGIMALLIPAMVLAMPIFDTTLVTVTRLWRGQSVSNGGRDHSSHRLVGLGLSEGRAVWVLYGFAVGGGALATLMQRFPEQLLAVLGFYLLLLLFTGIYLGRLQLTKDEAGQPPPQWTPLVSTLLFKRHAAELILDTFLILICFYTAYLLRFEGTLSDAARGALYTELPMIITTGLLGNFAFGVYLGQWRFITLADLPRYAGGVLAGTGLASIILLVTGFSGSGHSHTAFVIFAVLLFLCLVGCRMSFRLFDLFLGKRRRTAPDGRQPILIYGAGKAGKLLCEEMLCNSDFSAYEPVGFIDDDTSLHGSQLCDLPVLSRDGWLGKSWNMAPHIWVSSRLIPQEKAQRLAAQWAGQGHVRRFRWLLEPVSDKIQERHVSQRGRRQNDHCTVEYPNEVGMVGAALRQPPHSEPLDA